MVHKPKHPLGLIASIQTRFAELQKRRAEYISNREFGL
jgi:hypothetical protein